MMKSAILRSFPILVEAKDVHGGKAKFVSSCSSPTPMRVGAAIRCSDTRDLPKLEPFSRSKLDRIVRDPPLIEKSEIELADYCSTLEGDESYSCWRAYFELKELEKETPKEEVEKLILQAGGTKSLIGCLHGIALILKEQKDGFTLSEPFGAEKEREKPFHIPDGLPKSLEELEEEERAKMPDSPYTRLLRTKGRFPAWYSPAPDHETD